MLIVTVALALPGVPSLVILNPPVFVPKTSSLCVNVKSSKKSNFISRRLWSDTSNTIVLPDVKLRGGLTLAI